MLPHLAPAVAQGSWAIDDVRPWRRQPLRLPPLMQPPPLLLPPLLGSSYFAYEKSAVVCELGRLMQDGDNDGEPQRTSTRTIRGCLIKDARDVVG